MLVNVLEIFTDLAVCGIRIGMVKAPKSYEKMITANKLATKFFVAELFKYKQPYKYAEKRLGLKIISKYKIGYASRNGALGDYLKEHGVSRKTAVQAGIYGHNDKNEVYPFFYKRIVLPIVHAGIIVGFGGRSLTPNQSAKYINTRRTKLYNKKEILFGLWFARKHIIKKKFVIVVEGYMDWYALVKHNIYNVVAVCGTALTQEHILSLKRYTDNVCIITDGDSAGVKASEKMAKLLNKNGVDHEKLKLPNNLDPDEYVHKFGKKKLTKKIRRVMEL